MTHASTATAAAASVSYSLIGQQLRTPDGQRLLLRSILGKGAYGTVYLARARRASSGSATLFDGNSGDAAGAESSSHGSATPPTGMEMPQIAMQFSMKQAPTVQALASPAAAGLPEYAYTYYAVKHLDDRSTHTSTAACGATQPSPETIKRRRRRQRREAALHRLVSSRAHMSSGDPHPNIVRLVDAVESTDRLHRFLILDYCPDGDLYAFITQQLHHLQPASADWVVRDGFQQIVHAVAWCHSQGVFHRDLKCENILLRRLPNSQEGVIRLRLYLADFGFAITDAEHRQRRLAHNWCNGYGSKFYQDPSCLSRKETRTGAIAATSGIASLAFFPDMAGTTVPRRPPPPQLPTPEDYHPAKHDVWSLGVILCNMTTQRHPWRVADDAEDNNYAFYRRAELAEQSEQALHDLLGIPTTPDAVYVPRILAGCWRGAVRLRWSAEELKHHWQRLPPLSRLFFSNSSITVASIGEENKQQPVMLDGVTALQDMNATAINEPPDVWPDPNPWQIEAPLRPPSCAPPPIPATASVPPLAIHASASATAPRRPVWWQRLLRPAWP